MGIAEMKGFPAALGCLPFPARQWRLRVMDIVRAQAIEEIVTGIEGPDMVETEPLPAAAVTGHLIGQWCAEFALLAAAGHCTEPLLGASMPTMKTGGGGGNGVRIPSVGLKLV